jgi:uncharacterized membrane protein
MDDDTAWAPGDIPFLGLCGSGDGALHRASGFATLTSIKAAAVRIADSALLSRGDVSVTTEAMLIVGAITAAFALFAVTLWRAERMTRDLKRD